MSAPSVINGNVHVIGTLSATDLAMPANVVSNNNVNTAAGIEATKLQHQHHKDLQRQVPAGETDTVHIAYGAGTVVNFRAMCRTVPAAGKSYTIDLKKNAVSILTAVITFNNSSTPLVPQVATLASNTYVAGDILSITITDVAGGTLGTDLYCDLIVREAAAP